MYATGSRYAHASNAGCGHTGRYQIDNNRDTYFSLHVFSVQFAYIRAAGSVFARNPTRWGGLSSAFRPSVTSASSPRATEAARTTLHDAGPLSGSAAMMNRYNYENMQVEMDLFAYHE